MTRVGSQRHRKKKCYKLRFIQITQHETTRHDKNQRALISTGSKQTSRIFFSSSPNDTGLSVFVIACWCLAFQACQSIQQYLTLRVLMSYIYIYIYIYIYGAPILDVSRSRTTTHHSRQDSSGRVISSSQRPLPDNTRHSQQTNIHAPGGIRTQDLSR